MTFYRRIARPFTKAAKERTSQADPNGGRCLVSGRDDPEAVHVAARDLTTDLTLMRSVEWAWGLREERLNLDTRTNVMFLGAALHALYKRKKWALLPEEGIIDQFFYQPDPTSPEFVPRPRQSFPQISGETFRYTFLPLADGFSGLGIVRGVGDGATVHTYPFTTLPVLISHIHPKFVLLHLTLTLAELKSEPFIANLVATNPSINKIEKLRSHWTIPKFPILPLDWATDPSFIPIPVVKDEDSKKSVLDRQDSEATCPGRVDYPEHLLTNPPVRLRKIRTVGGAYRWGYARDGIEGGEMYVVEGSDSEEDVEMETDSESRTSESS